MNGFAKVITTLIGSLMLLVWMAADNPMPYSLSYPSNFGNRISIPKNNPTSKAGVYLGRHLFYEGLLSANNKISCSSCHEQKRAFTDGRTFSIGVDGSKTSRNSMALVNLLWTRKFFWDGRTTGLEAQAAFPLSNPHEMGQPLAVSAAKLRRAPKYPALFKNAFGDTAITPERITQAIAQFERTLISAGSPYDKYLAKTYIPSTLELEGMQLFNTMPQPGKKIRGADCAHCHGGVKTYLELFHNNGLDEISADQGIAAITGLDSDHGRFKIPTLRNIALTAPYMHDGRFSSLQQVLDHYSEHLKQKHLSPFLKGSSNKTGATSLQLSAHEKKAVIAFLNMLTDTAFTRNPEFSNPNKPITPLNK
ncbi:Cytochrome c551 peroxidase precursor [compost metagenome]